jgi:two-component system copper resistance phosphate regulon response regulator CusR
MNRILLVEDQPTAAHYISKGLTEAGMVVDVAHNGPDGLHLLLTTAYDLAILDVMLPGVDGWTILETSRRAGRTTPVLFLTARDDVDDRVRGLESGAEDYLVKPFAYTELLARVRVILRRHAAALADPQGRPATELKVADLSLDLLRRRATRAGNRIELTPKEFSLLSFLMSRPGEVLSRTVIATQVWDMNFDSDTNVVEVAIKRLRSKIDDPYESKLLHTVRGVGYVLDAQPS